MQAPQLLEAMRSELADIDARLDEVDPALYESDDAGEGWVKPGVIEYRYKLFNMINMLADILEEGPYPDYKAISRIHKHYVDQMEGV